MYAHVNVCACRCRYTLNPAGMRKLFLHCVGFAFHVWQEIFYCNDIWKPNTHTLYQSSLLCPQLLISPLFKHLLPSFHSLPLCIFPSPPHSVSLLCLHHVFDLLSLPCRCTIHWKSILKTCRFEISWAAQMFCHKMLFNLSFSNLSQFKTTRTCGLNRQLWCEVGHCRGLTSVKRSVQGLCSHTSHSVGFREGHHDRE